MHCGAENGQAGGCDREVHACAARVADQEGQGEQVAQYDDRAADSVVRAAVVARAVAHGKLGDVRYVYTWDRERIFKIVSFYLLRYSRGRLGDLPPAVAHEVAEARWLPLEEAPRLLAYKGEREMAERALASVHDRPL